MTVVKFKRRDVNDLRDDMNRLYDEFFDQDRQSNRTWTPPLNLSETGDSYVVTVELPGINKQNININLKDDVLHISGEKKRPESQDDVFKSECCYGRFQRSIMIPGQIDRDKITAKHVNGILTVKLPKSEEKKPKEIEIK